MVQMSSLVLFFILIPSTFGSLCYNCLSPDMRFTFKKYSEILTTSQSQFPLGAFNCSEAVQIPCEGPCVGIKVDSTSRGHSRTGYIHACANEFLSASKLLTYPVTAGSRRCFGNKKTYGFSSSADITYCLCQEDLCNDLHNDFFGSVYNPPIKPAETSGLSAPSNFFGSTTNSAPSTTSSSIFTSSPVFHIYGNVTPASFYSVSLSSIQFVDPIKLIFPNIILAFIILQL